MLGQTVGVAFAGITQRSSVGLLPPIYGFAVKSQVFRLTWLWFKKTVIISNGKQISHIVCIQTVFYLTLRYQSLPPMSSPDSVAAFVDALALATSGFRTFMRQQLKAVDLDLTAEMLQVLRYLWAHDGVNQQEIANAVNKDKATLTSMLDNLVRRGLVERQEDSQDRRSKRIRLTRKGWALEQQIAPMMDNMYAVAGLNLSAEKLRASIALLKQIAENLDHQKE
jgi:DNA-binding MarR family transcriptional regulator